MTRNLFFISYMISRVADIKWYNWIKTLIFIKYFERFPLGTLSFLLEIYPIGIILLDSMIFCTINVQEIQGGGGSLSKKGSHQKHYSEHASKYIFTFLTCWYFSQGVSPKILFWTWIKIKIFTFFDLLIFFIYLHLSYFRFLFLFCTMGKEMFV